MSSIFVVNISWKIVWVKCNVCRSDKGHPRPTKQQKKKLTFLDAISMVFLLVDRDRCRMISSCNTLVGVLNTEHLMAR